MALMCDSCTRKDKLHLFSSYLPVVDIHSVLLVWLMESF